VPKKAFEAILQTSNGSGDPAATEHGKEQDEERKGSIPDMPAF
jgi:hypothetical protein